MRVERQAVSMQLLLDSFAATDGRTSNAADPTQRCHRLLVARDAATRVSESRAASGEKVNSSIRPTPAPIRTQ